MLPRHDLDPRRVPLLPFPSLDAHGSERKQRDGPVSFAKLDSASDGRDGARDSDFRVNPEIAGEGEVKRVRGGGAVRGGEVLFDAVRGIESAGLWGDEAVEKENEDPPRSALLLSWRRTARTCP